MDPGARPRRVPAVGDVIEVQALGVRAAPFERAEVIEVQPDYFRARILRGGGTVARFLGAEDRWWRWPPPAR